MEAAGRKEKMKKKGKEKKARRLEHLGAAEGAAEGEEEDEEEEEQEEEEGQVQALVRAEFEGEEAKEMKRAKEDLGVKEEAPRAPYGREDLKGGGPTVDSGSLHEDRDKEDKDELADEIADGKLDKDKEEGKKKGVLLNEEALRAPYELEDLKGGGPTVDSGSLHEVSCIPSSLFFPLASSTQACVASSHEPAMGVADKTEKEKGKGKEEGVLSLKRGERESELKHELQAPGASQTASPSMPLVSPSQHLFHGRQDSERREIRLGLPSNGRIFDETLGLLKDCGLPVERDSPQQYVSTIPQLPNLRVFFQHPEEIVRNLSSGHLDIGIVGFDMVSESRQGNDDLIIVHNDLGYGHCHLSLAIPKIGIFERINSVKELAQMSQWTEENPLRVVTGLPNLGNKFMQENGPKHVSILTARGPLEAAPAMGTADVILNFVSSGTTLGDNNLKEIEGGTALESRAVLVASRKSLVQQGGVRETTREILDRLEARLKAVGQIKVTANMRGRSKEEVAERVLSQLALSGLQVDVSPGVFMRDGEEAVDCYAIVICLPEKVLYSSVQQLRAVTGSVLVSPLTYIFDGESPRWQQLLSELEPHFRWRES